MEIKAHALNCEKIQYYSARLALHVHVFIHGITSAKRTCEVRPAVLVRESSTQL